jgi:hypothetical protein
MVKPSKKLAIGMVLLLLLVSVLGSSARGDEPLEDRVLRRVANEQNVPVDRLEMGAMEAVALPLTGLTLYQAKVIDRATGEIAGLVVDGGGRVRNLEDARAAERVTYEARYGRLQPDLFDRLETMADDGRLTVAIWLEAGDVTLLSRPAAEYQPSVGELPASGPGVSGSADEKADAGESEALEARVAATKAAQAEQRAELEAYQEANLAHLETQVAAAEAPLLADLAAKGVEPEYVSPYAPLVYVTLPKREILALAQRGDVDAVYGPNENYDLMDSAKPTQKADVVDNAWGFDGSGIDVAILEDSRVEFTNPYLIAGTTRDMGGSADRHATATAGIVASQHGTYQGIAQGVDLYSANAPGYTDPNLSAAMDWAVSQGAEIINNSWGGNAGTTTLNDHDRHLDYIVRNSWRTVTVAAGNESDGCGNFSGRVDSPGRGYNVITVGNYADQNTLTWDDDAMDACSSFVDPVTGIEKPEVAAVGASINSTWEVSPWVGNVGSGTSYSAPMVGGEAALLMERQASLTSWPEAVKAIVIASALNNIEGSSRLSEYDGAGGVDMRAAFRIVDEGWWGTAFREAGDFPYSLYADFYAGETVRAAIAWDSNPDGSYTTDPLNADLDLMVYDPDGISVGGSTSFDNSYEIAEFTAPKTGTYELRVSAWRFDGAYEYVGAAWWPGHRVLAAYTPQTLSAPPVSGDYYRFSAQPLWNAVGIRPASGSDHDVYLYADSAFGDPADHDWLEDSTLSGTVVDFVVLDRNHAPSGNYYPEVREWSGTGNYTIEWATHSQDTVGTYGPYVMSPSQVLRVWDSYLAAGVRKYFAIKPVSGNADLGMALYDSDPGTSSTWYQGRSQSLVLVDAAGPGGDEYMNHQTGTSDWMGLVVWNNGATSTTTFYLYTDTSAPTGSISINGGAPYVNTTSVTLNLSASDGETGVAEMRFSNNGSTWSSWQPYASTKSWTLLSGDGTKTVYVQFRNNANMSSGSYSDTIILDTAPPTGSITINGGATYATSTSVSLGLSASDGLSGVDDMRFSNNGSSWSGWEPYGTSKAWSLISGDGTKTVYVQYRDNIGNISTPYNDSIVLDTTAPTGSIVVNGGAPYATSTSVSLGLSASDPTSGVDDMRFLNEGSSWTSWEPYAPTKSWTLPTPDGSKTVYVQYRDNVGHVSTSYSDSIILDRAPPAGSILIDGGATYANSTSVALGLSATDATSGVDAMRFSNNGSSWSSWEPYTTGKAWTLSPGDGGKTVYVQYQDNAGNVSGSYSDGIVLDTTAPSGSILVDGGATYATSTAVSLGLSASDGLSGMDAMRFSNNGSSWSSWESYGASKSWTLSPGDGTKTVYVQYRDNAGNVSGSFSDNIILDTTAPTGSIAIDGGAAYANSTSVSLDLSASDPTSGVDAMRFSNDGSSWSGWEPYGTSKSWTLTSGDGTKTVYVQYLDNVGHVSSSFSDTIILDTAAPTGSVLIEGGAPYVNSTSVALDLSATDGLSGLDAMRFSNDGSSWSGWLPYAAGESWTLTSGDGSKTVYVEYRDNAGNVSASFTDSIILDTIAPAGSILIDGGASYANSPSLALGLSATDAASGVDAMRFSNDGSSWSSWEPYATSKTWTLTPGDGTKTVYVQYQDNAGNASGSFSDTIILDMTAPTGSIVIDGGAAYATSTSVALTLSASDGLSGVDAMRFSNNGSTFSAWEPYSTSKSWTLGSGDGTKTVYVQYSDYAGNLSSSYSDTIILDTTAPTGTILIDGGATYANSTSVALGLSASDAGAGVEDMRFSNNGSSWTAWEPYSTARGWTLDPGDGTKTVYVQYRDDVDNVSSSFTDSIMLDTIAPASGATSPPSTTSLWFTVSWSGSDGLSGIDTYDVQYRVGSGGAWTDWLVGTSSTSDTFGPASPVGVVVDQTYYFRARARDNAGNLEAYPGGDGDTSTYVQEVFPVYLPVTLRN